MASRIKADFKEISEEHPAFMVAYIIFYFICDFLD